MATDKIPEMVERVAEAIRPLCYDECSEKELLEFAAAAIEAMREPTEAMSKAGNVPIRWTQEVPPRLELPFGWTTTDAWRVMIDAALGE